MMKAIVRILDIIYDILQTVIILFAVVLLILFAVGIRPYTVITGSMEPEIPTGSVCFVDHRAEFQDVHEGDVIAFHAGSVMVTHRAVKITEDGIVTKGDANNTEDSSVVTSENFVGQTIFHVPRVGVLVMQVQTVRGKVILGLIAVMFIAVNVVLNRLKKGIEKAENTEVSDGKKQEENKA